MPANSLVIRNAHVRTCDPDAQVASTLVIRDGVLVHVGNDSTGVDTDGLDDYDLGGRTVLPGLVDSHTHPGMVARSAWHKRLPWTHDVNEILAFVRDYAEKHAATEEPFLYFEYYPGDTFAGSAPTKELLDTAVADRPCFLQDHGEHEHWVNSRMLELMGVTKDTPDPVPGLEMFVRDQHDEPTGQLREGVHQHFLDTMYDKLGWRPPEDLTAERIRPFLRFLTEHGVTAIFDAITEGNAMLAAVLELDRRDELNMYYDGALRFRDLADLPGVLDDLAELQNAYGGKRIRMRTVKLFLDGTNELGNSALLAPKCDYSGASDVGEIALTTDELTSCLLLCNEREVDVHIHMVGDRAFRVGCDAVELAKEKASAAGLSWRTQVTFAHCELIDPADMHRPAALGIVINWTTHWSGGYFGEGARHLLGPERWNRMYQFNQIAESGAIVSFSSDVVTAYEAHRAAPFFGMHVAETRVDPEFPVHPDLFPGSVRPEPTAGLSRELLLDGYTRNGALQLRLDDKIGSIAPGKAANLVVVSSDRCQEPPARRAGRRGPLRRHRGCRDTRHASGRLRNRRRSSVVT